MSDEIRRFSEQVEVEYWSCSSPECGTKHQTEDAARRCQLHRSWVTRAERAEGKDYGRKIAIVVLHARGHSFAKIGEAFGISGSRAQQIHNATKARLNKWIQKFESYFADNAA
jgi:hypothetical protein